ncbi:MAG: zinc ribbon domain-containing protein [Thermoplasmata archaeon]
MADGDSKKCGLCGTELEAGSDVCPNCGADLSLLDLDDGEGLDTIKESASLDDLLATVLDEPELASPKKEEGKEEGKSIDDLDLDLEIPDDPVEKPKLDLEVLEEDSSPPADPKPHIEPEVSTGSTDTLVEVASEEVEPVPEVSSAPKPSVEVLPEDEGLTYECPECGAKVAENAPMCFSCGALFTEESLVCPECGAEVAAGSAQCPQCGVHFIEEGEAASPGGTAEVPDLASPAIPEPSVGLPPPASGQLVRTILDRYETLERQPFSPSSDPMELQRSLQEFVIYLRGLIILAKAVRVPTESVQLKIADATKRARARDLDGAVRMSHSAKLALEQSLSLQIAKRLEMIQTELDSLRAQGTTYPVAESLVQRAIGDLEAGRVQSAYERLERTKEDMAASSGSQTDARYALQTAREMVDEVAPLGLADDRLQSSLARGESALREGNWEAAAQMATSVQERAKETLQDGLAGEMKRIREKVMQLKIQGRDVSRPIALLKQAGASIKKKSYEDAMRYLDLVKQDIST